MYVKLPNNLNQKPAFLLLDALPFCLFRHKYVLLLNMILISTVFLLVGFYELSDGASGSLSNSSNSVFSECLSSCHSSTCFCSPLEAALTISDGCPKSAGKDF